jgi:hypothetical protein
VNTATLYPAAAALRSTFCHEVGEQFTALLSGRDRTEPVDFFLRPSVRPASGRPIEPVADALVDLAGCPEPTAWRIFAGMLNGSPVAQTQRRTPKAIAGDHRGILDGVVALVLRDGESRAGT